MLSQPVLLRSTLLDSGRSMADQLDDQMGSYLTGFRRSVSR